jgi:putative endonuclease
VVEVKTRSGNSNIEDVMSLSKEQNVLEATDRLMSDVEEDFECRIDLLVLTRKGRDFDINHIEDAIHPA